MKISTFNIFLISMLLGPSALAQSSVKMLDLLDKQQMQKHIDDELKNVENRVNNQDNQNNMDLNKSGQTFIFKDIVFVNPDDNTAQALQTVSDYKNKQIYAQDILQIVKKTSNYFINKGFTTSIVTIAGVDRQKDILLLKIEYGFVNNVYLNQKKSLRITLGSPLTADQIFNIYDVDSTLENLQRVNNNVNVDVKASDKDGYSDIYFTEQRKYLDLSVGFDNSGTRALGQYKLNSAISLYNPLNLNDIFTANFIGGILKQYPDNKSNVYAFNYSFPIKNWLFSYALQYSDSQNYVKGYVSNYFYNTDTYKHIFTIKDTVYRNQTDKLSLYTNLTIRDTTNKIADVRLDNSSGKYTSLSLGAEYSTYLLKGYFYSSLEYQKGVGILGSKTNDPNSDYTILYNKINLNMSYQKYLYADNDFAILYRGNFGASYSPDKLLNDDKFLVGDEYTVRGFKESSAAWDWGMYINNTLSYQFTSSNELINAIEPFVGLDYGYGADYLLNGTDKLFGVAFGFRLNFTHAYLSVTGSKTLHKSSNMPYETMPVYATFSVMF